MEAVYEGGVLRPLRRVNLRDGERVVIVIVRGSGGLAEAIRRLSREYSGVREDPLKSLTGGRR
ncbi:antitoxin family protein [Pyrolobus fumarii]|uniref:antitoxin family protein n=1 Tax=Pyrolobus fumarii TaxID=54252 RepID=UPI001FCAC3B1|nr:antitoxin family protein [Pyrolobus fumarii]